MNNSLKEQVNAARAAFIKDVQQKHGGKKLLKYIGLAKEDEVPEDAQAWHKSRLQGIEHLIECHKFEVTSGPTKGLKMLMQWRLKIEN